jgi:endonuclease YncB( thermonuclease family)
VSRHKFLTGFIAAVLLISFFNAVSGAGGDQSPSSDASSEDTGDSSSLSSDNQSSSPEPTPSPSPKPKPRTYHVIRVADGDTVDLGNGETVRLAGIDAPEVGECGHKRARNMLAELPLLRPMRIVTSTDVCCDTST